MSAKKEGFFKSEFFHNFVRSPGAMAGLLIVTFFVVLVTAGPLFTPQNPYDIGSLDLMDAFKPPVWMEGGDPAFVLGTDDQGRDLLSAMVYGSRISLFIGLSVVVLSCVLGTFLGLTAGYFGGRLDSLLMRIVDIQLSFPAMLVALFIMAAFGRGLGKLVTALTIVGWVLYARTVRGSVLVEKKKEYVDAARLIGLSPFPIILRHVLPNILTPLIVIATIHVGTVILTEATLSYLGVGVPVTRPSLGLLVKNGYDVLFSGLWWSSVFPGMFIMLLVFGINLLGDFLRDEFNPRLK
ncbi:peptide/nickel transport system permease protein [Aminivibrio pyruvatiphilus]|jgi:peptide/nickel transport system permease protein|uniref:Peptide/nickel transport system permease protein n=1 Tax=Aminivibrio pyruvatiphilus TaxID=1005740 RepID=A0A4R8MAX2_9BACT|nr:ABC transporter permease [Aminivibrio pyruvatiphilus]MBP6333748.1 ABC transporter permease [Aminivibrio sp.]TDY62839.1 peptide/nickel transport system permease protein [Aminivibrio pyruvatiphilus]